MWDHLSDLSNHIAEGIWAMLGLAGEKTELGDMAKNIVISVVSLLLAGAAGGAVTAWSQANENASSIEGIEQTQQRILDKLDRLSRNMQRRQ